MHSHQAVMLQKPDEPPNPKPDSMIWKLDDLSSDFGIHSIKTMVSNLEGFIGVLEVYIHQARDIQNICIYQKQDVYAKLSVTSDPETTVSTQIINGGGMNPVFNENHRLNVRTIDSSLKCEIWMLSRVRNYLEDQLLGFALVPLSDVLIKNEKLSQEFSLSSTDMFHSPAGFVQLSLMYTGASPEVLEIPRLHSSLAVGAGGNDSTVPDSPPCELDKIEFPDPKIVNENHLMVSEYYRITCSDMDSQSSESLATAGDDNQLSSDNGAQTLERFSASSVDLVEVLKVETPPTIFSANGSPSVTVPAAASSPCDNATPKISESLEDVGGAGSSSPVPSSALAPPIVSVETEEKAMQQEIVDMYLKSMQQFTESLAKMKLPVNIENGSGDSTNTGSDEKIQASTDAEKLDAASKGNGQRVFYGSRAFF